MCSGHRSGPALSQPATPPGDSVSTRRRHRHHRPHPRAKTGARAGPEHAGGKQARRGRRDRLGHRRQVGARRLHHPDRHLQHPLGGAGPGRQAALRRGTRLRARGSSVRRATRAGGLFHPAIQERVGVDRRGQGQAGRLQLQFFGRWHHRAVIRRGVQAGGEDRPHAHSLQRHGAGVHRPGHRPGRADVRQHRLGATEPQIRQGARAGRDVRPPQPP